MHVHVHVYVHAHVQDEWQVRRIAIECSTHINIQGHIMCIIGVKGRFVHVYSTQYTWCIRSSYKVFTMCLDELDTAQRRVQLR